MNRLSKLKMLPGKLKEMISAHPVIGFLIIMGFLVLFGTTALKWAGYLTEASCLKVQAPVIVIFILLYIYPLKD